MKAIRIHNYGEASRVDEVATPEAGPGEVLICVEAAALNPLDGKLASGTMARFFPLAFPYTIGTDLAGTVEGVGADIADKRVGDQVIARLDPAAGGVMAEVVTVVAGRSVAQPAGLTATGAAGIPTASGTAWLGLFGMAGLRAGQTVLIHAGAGGVGSFAVQLAHAAGAHVVATESGDGVELVRGLGADRVVDHRSEDFAAAVSGADVVLDTIGGDVF